MLIIWKTFLGFKSTFVCLLCETVKKGQLIRSQGNFYNLTTSPLEVVPKTENPGKCLSHFWGVYFFYFYLPHSLSLYLKQNNIVTKKQTTITFIGCPAAWNIKYIRQRCTLEKTIRSQLLAQKTLCLCCAHSVLTHTQLYVDKLNGDVSSFSNFISYHIGALQQQMHLLQFTNTNNE